MTDLAESLTALYRSLRGQVRAKWKRDLPFDELLFDRWERARSLGFGERSSIYQHSHVYGDVTVGEGTWIGPYTLLDGSGGLVIGAYCSISAGVQIYSHDSVQWALTGGAAGYQRAPVRIGDRCYIGPQSVISKGVTIGDRCVIGAGSFVNRSLPPNTVAFGTPCRPAGTVQLDEDGTPSVRIDAP